MSSRALAAVDDTQWKTQWYLSNNVRIFSAYVVIVSWFRVLKNNDTRSAVSDVTGTATLPIRWLWRPHGMTHAVNISFSENFNLFFKCSLKLSCVLRPDCCSCNGETNLRKVSTSSRGAKRLISNQKQFLLLRPNGEIDYTDLISLSTKLLNYIILIALLVGSLSLSLVALGLWRTLLSWLSCLRVWSPVTLIYIPSASRRKVCHVNNALAK
jgi:hypothetical protein